MSFIEISILNVCQLKRVDFIFGIFIKFMCFYSFINHEQGHNIFLELCGEY